MADILKEAEISDPNNIIVEDEDEEYEYDLRKKLQTPKGYHRRRLLRFVTQNRHYSWLILGTFLVYKLYSLVVFKTYLYYTRSFHDIENSDFVSITQETILHTYHSKLMSGTVDWSKYSYVLYATNLNYLCASLMVFEKLRKDYRSQAHMTLFYHTDLSQHDQRDDYTRFANDYITVAESLGVSLIPIRSFVEDENVDDSNFKSSFNKLLVFQYKDYPEIQNYERLIYLDADIHLNDKLDELFFLPDEFDIAMPMAYWLVDPQKNYKNYLTSYPSIEPNFASSESKNLNYFRIQHNDQNALKWSTALMVIKPSHALSDAIQEGLVKRTSSDYDMDIINDVLERRDDLRRLTIPHKNYFMITGDIFLTPENRFLYLTDPLDLQFVNKYSLGKCYTWYGTPKKGAPYWCKVDTKAHSYLEIAKNAKIIHFSDFPLAKPWYQSFIKVTCDKQAKGKRNVLHVENCDDYNFWGNYHNLFIRNRLNVCHLYQDIEDI